MLPPPRSGPVIDSLARNNAGYLRLLRLGLSVWALGSLIEIAVSTLGSDTPFSLPLTALWTLFAVGPVVLALYCERAHKTLLQRGERLRGNVTGQSLGHVTLLFQDSESQSRRGRFWAGKRGGLASDSLRRGASVEVIFYPKLWRPYIAVLAEDGKVYNGWYR